MDLGEVPQLEVDQACEEREAALDRKLKDWERQLVKAYLTNRKLKELSPEERLSIPDFDKVISLRLEIQFGKNPKTEKIVLQQRGNFW